MGIREESRQIVEVALRGWSVAVEPIEDAVFRFEYRSVPMRISFDETKHGDADMTIELDEKPTIDRMACRAYRVIIPHWWNSWSDGDDAEFRTMFGSTLETLADDALELQRLTAEAQQDVVEVLDSNEIPHVVAEDGGYQIEWNSVPLTMELCRKPGETWLIVSMEWGRKGFMTGRTWQHLAVPVDGEEFLHCMDSMVRINREEAQRTNLWFGPEE